MLGDLLNSVYELTLQVTSIAGLTASSVPPSFSATKAITDIFRRLAASQTKTAGRGGGRGVSGQNVGESGGSKVGREGRKEEDDSCDFNVDWDHILRVVDISYSLSQDVLAVIDVDKYNLLQKVGRTLMS